MLKSAIMILFFKTLLYTGQIICITCIGDGVIFFKTQKNSACPIEQIIESESLCKYATSQLQGLKYITWLRTTNRPPGCFWKDENQIFFNKITDPSITTISPLRPMGGICNTYGFYYGIYFSE